MRVKLIAGLSRLNWRIILPWGSRSSSAQSRSQKSEVNLEKELRLYNIGRARLAEIMGADPETFTEQDVQDALRYLLPTSLSARDARPFIKHPSEVFPQRTESLFDEHGRPLDAGFYTGTPSYFNLLYSIHQLMAGGRSSDDLSGRGPDDHSALCPDDQSELGPDDQSELGPDDHSALCPDDQSECGLNDQSGQGPDDQSELGPDDQRSPGVRSWLKKETMANVLAEELTDSQYKDLTQRLDLLAKQQAATSASVREFLDTYSQPSFGSMKQVARSEDTSRGVLVAVGKRKTSTALVKMRLGEGEVVVNGRPFIEYFPRQEDREQVFYPLLVTNTLGQYSITASVRGGGTTGQAGAIRLGISKALTLSGSYGNELEECGLLVRDSRSVERKKPGQKKARKKFAWVKR